tara:strand:- start:976 stop:1167 length:192 start_codon:yes stop_codon:yes gene_type:complete
MTDKAVEAGPLPDVDFGGTFLPKGEQRIERLLSETPAFRSTMMEHHPLFEPETRRIPRQITGV